MQKQSCIDIIFTGDRFDFPRMRDTSDSRSQPEYA